LILFKPITAVVVVVAAGCTAIINILEPGAFYPEFQHFISIFNKNFITFANNNRVFRGT
jgi:hypothetical protein